MSAESPSPVALDTSVAVPLLVETHSCHDVVSRWARARTMALCGHAAVETYSVLTRLPGDIRLTPTDAVTIISSRFEQPFVLGRENAARVPEILAERGVSGGAVYDGLVALAAVEHHVRLATRDRRAKSTYDALGVATEVVD